MISVPSGSRIWLALGHTDMRRGMRSLARQVQEVLKKDVHAGDLFVFRGRNGSLCKILWHDGIGLSLFNRRLERGRFVWPTAKNGRIQDRIEVAQQCTPSVFHRGGGERGDIARKAKGAIEPEFEPHADKVAAVLLDEARLAVEMGKAGLVVQPMTLLAGIAIRYPHVGLVPGHRVAHHLGGVAEPGGMNDDIARAEYPLVAVAALDPHSCLAALACGSSQATTVARRKATSASSRLAAKIGAARLNMFISAPWLIQPEQIGKNALQPCSRW